ncbi:ribosomal-protein-alanine N-acetyltransferase [Zhengella mangrovi]|uniref:Ribosomal-protein-alanine N-acetyltransferase n=1 Tax=Zhengella mangrovi TaxID=1982044 RepID=A0A2G1QU29_9HYPH|nr:ribosomal protein S18-alanine N-acetyltransferase [Zhengella mangrovi]PHP69033.1 ribosomal-protein-alanine N-acetyltransferase [Zhengella mangrovi]
MKSLASFWSKTYVAIAAGPEAAQAMARLHEEDFIRPWTDGEFVQLLKQDTVFAFVACQEGKGVTSPAGFVLARLAAGEAEILTIAVARSVRRRGIGRLLMDAVMRKLHADRAESLFLEVDETNAPAIALYRRFGFRKVGERKAYYDAGDGSRNSAIVMRADFR